MSQSLVLHDRGSNPWSSTLTITPQMRFFFFKQRNYICHWQTYHIRLIYLGEIAALCFTIKRYDEHVVLRFEYVYKHTDNVCHLILPSNNTNLLTLTRSPIVSCVSISLIYLLTLTTRSPIVCRVSMSPILCRPIKRL